MPPGGNFDYMGRCTNPRLALEDRVGYCRSIIRTGRRESETATLVLANLYGLQHKFDDALQLANLMLAKAPTSRFWTVSRVGALITRAVIYETMGKITDALQDADEVVAIDDDDAGGYAFRCWIRASAGVDLPKATADCEHALSEKPRLADAFVARALINLKLAKLNEAISDANAALDHDSHNPQALYFRGLAEVKLGNADAGQKDIADAKARDVSLALEMADCGLPQN